MTTYTAWFETDVLTQDPEGGYPLALAAMHRSAAIRESQGLLVQQLGLGRRAGFRLFDDTDGRLVCEGRLTAC